MGLLPNYNKEGPGVYVDDPKHGPFIRFFQTYASKFFKLCTTNLMFVLFNIPSIIIAYLGVVYFLPQINPIFETTAFQKYLTDLGIAVADSGVSSDAAAMQVYFLLVILLVMFVVGMQLVCVGPVQTGLSYLYRSFARETPTFMWSDFSSSFKSNWKQAVIVSVISVLVSSITVMNIAFYSNVYSGRFSQIFSAVFVMLFIFYICIQIFVYPLIASVDLKLKDIYKNSVLFFLGRLLPTLGIFLVDVVVLLVIPLVMLFSFTYAGFGLAIFYYLFFAFSFVHYLNTFFVWQQIERYIIKPQEMVEQIPGASE